MEKYSFKTLNVQINNLRTMPPMPENNVRVIRMTVGQAEHKYPDLLGNLHQGIWIPGTSEQEMAQSLSWDVELVFDYDSKRVEVWTLSTAEGEKNAR